MNVSREINEILLKQIDHQTNDLFIVIISNLFWGMSYVRKARYYLYKSR